MSATLRGSALLEEELVDQAVKLLSTAIGMIMEDHGDDALTGTGPDRFEVLRSAGEDISVLSRAAQTLMNRR